MPQIAVIIATKNRPEEIARCSLPSLNRSDFRDFVCVVWDASDDDRTQKAAESREWNFPLQYFRAPRAGLTSQRNDATGYVLKSYHDVQYLVFIDDDSELSRDALGGVRDTFAETSAWGINIPLVPHLGPDGLSVPEPGPFGRRTMTPYLHNQGSGPEQHGVPVDWLSGCSMAFRREVFSEPGLRFPEAFQRFGGYALGEDVALSFFLKKKCGKVLMNSLSGAVCHHAAGGARLNISNMTASKWYNFHLLFEAIYDDVHGARRAWLKLKFKLFMIAAAFKVPVRAWSFNFPEVFRGIARAQSALVEYHGDSDIKALFTNDSAPGGK